MTLAHIMGIPVEEGVLQLAPAGAAMVTALAIAGRKSLGRLQHRLRHRSRGEEHKRETMGEGAGVGALSAPAMSSSTT